VTIRVLVVDDSRLVREILVDIIDSHSDMRVVGVAEDPYQARALIDELKPDVLTLDVEMPHMSGLQFLEKLMRARPMPVVMISAHTQDGSAVTLQALELGAVDFVPKPRLNARLGDDYRGVVAEKIRAACMARVQPPPARALAPPVRAPASVSRGIQSDRCDRVIAVGASTGGTEALRALLTRFPADAPAVLVAQHMPEYFTRLFAERLNGLCQIRVQEAENNQPVRPGHAYIAPGGQHLRVHRTAEQGRFTLQLSTDDPVNLHRPSVDVLFDSAASALGNRAVGVILTGMGRDGAAGLLRMKRAGAYTLAQDEASSVVFGMPREAIALGAADEVAPIHTMAERVLEAVRARRVVDDADATHCPS
jgi:two-component system, chemotaxis family, protein-glutamate methylesterase/glutaminase